MGNRVRCLLGLLMLVGVGVGIGACGDNRSPDTDAPPCTPVNDGNDCTVDLCDGDNPVNRPLDAGETCATGVCDGAGACVACLEDADCTTGEQICDEDSNTCVDPSCDDDEQNGDESDVDCGVACAPELCDDGLHCVVAGDCDSGVCTNTVCQAARCGDGVTQGTEACDDGNGINGDGCDDGVNGTCRPTGCGNGVVAGTEVCDDGNAINADGCDNNCTPSGCGNGIIAGAETCDQGNGNVIPGDGCSATCVVETGFNCTGIPSVCATTCGDAIRAGTEACDDGDGGGDGCTATCTVELGFVCIGSPSVCTATCGDGVKASTEACDDGDAGGDGCSALCTIELGFTCTGTTPSVCTATCGDGIRASTEACDDGGVVSGDGCSLTCTVEPGFTCTGAVPSVCTTTCGDGIRAGAEACDDPSPAENGDGCSLTCTVEPGYTCTGSPSVCVTACGDGIRTGTEACDDPAPAESGDGCSLTCTVEPGYTCTGSPSVCVGTCGDGIRAGTEACDDPAPAESGDGCSLTCTIEPGYTCTGTAPSVCTTTCGDGVRAGAEACDDSGVVNGDGCSATCTVEPGYTCTGSPSVCTTVCGDGIRNGTEVCDDGDLAPGDGCSAACAVEPGFTCTATSPSTCTAICGDGLVRFGEGCDDGNTGAGDGCSSTCAVEPGYNCLGQPSVCTPGCGDGIVSGAEQCDDLPPAESGDGCSAVCTVETGFTCAGSPSICTTTCGDGVIGGAETCDQGGGNVANGDGCSSTCTIETGYTCAGTPSVCAIVCGDGLITAPETCDQGGGNVANGDGCSSTCTIEPGFSCLGTPSVCAIVCGDGVVGGAETCDDGCLAGAPNVCEPADNNDGCSSTCLLECGNGTLQGNEQCDDSNRTSGDGCSATCAFEFSCAAGETLVQLRSTDVPKIIPDNTPAGIDSVVTVPGSSVGAVRKVNVGFGRITHTFDGDLALTLVAPTGHRRDLALNRGSSGDNFVTTRFDDTATLAIAAGSAPYSNVFRAEQTLSDAAGFGSHNPSGTWALHAVDSGVDDFGTIVGWTLALCVDPSTVCGNGTIDTAETCDDGNTLPGDGCNGGCHLETGYTCVGTPSTCATTCGDGVIAGLEQCDDGNAIAGDGCSAVCAVELTCGAGETPIVISATDVPRSIPDNLTAGVTSTVAIAAVGTVRKVIATVGQVTHGNDGHVDLFLVSPLAITRELSTDNPSANGVNFTSTIFNDASATLITAITAAQSPYRGVFRPEQSLSTTVGVDFLNQPSNGTWSLRVADDSSGTTGTLDKWTLALCVDTLAVCGNGTVDTGETCDDGNTGAGDGCGNLCTTEPGYACTGTPSTCVTVCGDGFVNGVEQCDDGNTGAGDGCSSSCTVEITCGAGETPLVVRSTAVPRTITDNSSAGVTSTVAIATTGAVRKVIATIGQITHANASHVDLHLIAPIGTSRELSTDNPSTGGVNFTSTIFNDAAAATIVGVTGAQSPYRGNFRPEQSASTTAGVDFLNLPANGTWTLRVVDDSSGTTGTLESWTLALCVDTGAVCGNGVVDAGEQCDDGNTAPGDGCNNVCRTEFGFACAGDPSTCTFTCGAGETSLFLTNTSVTPLVDNNGGLISTINVAVPGVVRAVMPIVNISHATNDQLDLFLTSPFGVQRELSSDQSGANYVATAFNDAATTAITAGTAPFTGAFRPEQTIATAAPSGFRNQTATGGWTLRIADDTTGTTGTLNGWSLAICVDSSVTSVCGNGIVELAETCDDTNAVNGDGCSTTCAVELTCGAAETAVFTRGTGPLIVQDAVPAGTLSPAAVGATGTVRKAIVVLGAISHQFDGDMTIALVAPTSASVALSTNLGSGGDDFVSTIFDDAATTAITTIVAAGAPYRARFRPQSVLTAVNGLAAAGVWNLRVADTAGTDAGVIGAWTLGLCVE